MHLRYCTGAVVARVRGACTRWLALAAVAAAGVAGAAANKGGQSARLEDSAGDVKNNAEPWQDIVRGGVVREGNTFTFSMETAEALPADPPAASGDLGWYLWLWGVDVEPDLAPAGFPFPNNHPAPHDLLVVFAADGEDYFAFVIDRRPLAVGEEPIITEVPFGLDGSSVDVFVDADLLDDPSDLLWRMASITSHAHFGSDGFQPVDRAPDSEADWVPWPAN